MELKLNGITVDCIIGDLPEERTRLQTLRVDLALTVGDAVASSDDLDDTVDYAALTDGVRLALMAAKCRMIERAAKVVLDLCRENNRIHHARVTVTKSGSVPHLESAAAILEF